MIPRVALLLLPILAFGQQHAPPGVEEELRARVTGLYNNFLVTSFTPRGAEAFLSLKTLRSISTTPARKNMSHSSWTRSNTRIISRRQR